MNWRWRNFVFFLLAIFSVIAIDRLTANIEDDRKVSQILDQNDSKKPNPKTSNTLEEKPTVNTRVVPLYEEGDLYISKLPESKKSPPRKPKTKPRKPTKKLKKLKKKITQKSKPKTFVAGSKKTIGDRPILEVAYDRIGFSRYLDVIERVGRLFILVETKKGTRLGPEISLKGRVLYSGVSDMSVLATKRPHLISDKRIHDRLSTIKIPNDAHNDRVVLILTKPFDDILWDTIKGALEKRKLHLNQVSRIIGDYEEGARGVFLLLDNVIIKGSGKIVVLNRRFRVSL